MPLRDFRGKGRLPGGSRRLILGEGIHGRGLMGSLPGVVVLASIILPNGAYSIDLAGADEEQLYEGPAFTKVPSQT